MNSIEKLTEKFGQSEIISFDKTGDIDVVNIHSELCHARIAMQGAQVLEWVPRGHQPIIWVSDEAVYNSGKSIRGGVPICWPWFGAHVSQDNFPAHGFARMVEWVLLNVETGENGEVKIQFRLVNNDLYKNMWPMNTPVEIHMSIGDSLELSLITQNKEKTPVTITEALHTYFLIGDIRKVEVEGLDKVGYLDKVQGFARFKQAGNIVFNNETDRVYIDTNSECIINDSVLNRRIHINKKGSLSTVVWNPWQEKADVMGDMGENGYLKMLCVESANAFANAVTIDPGETHKLMVKYHIE